jgi:CheY-like chemotaxis protein
MTSNGHCVLVVEDDEFVRGLIAALLEDEGYQVIAAGDGATALQRLADPAASPPEVILLDMWLPVIDGREFITAYRRRPGRHAPIIAMTGAFFTTADEPAPDVDELLSKPFDLEELLHLVRKHTRTPVAAPA